MEDIEGIERNWGPIGIWSAKYEKPIFKFYYPKKYDRVFRPFKYVYMAFFTGSPQKPGVTRDFVLYSTMHVEGCLKTFCWKKGLKGYEKKWIVPLAKLCGSLLGHDTEKSLLILGMKISNKAKHEYEVGTNKSLFSVEDAVATYLCCRKLGYDLLLLSGELPYVVEACEKGPFLGIDIAIPIA